MAQPRHIASSFGGLKCHISQPRKPLAPCLRLSDVNLQTAQAGSRSPPAVGVLRKAHLAARAGGPVPIVAENAPGNRCRRSPAQCRQRASLAYPCRPIPVLCARAGSVSTAATGVQSRVHCRCTGNTGRGRAGSREQPREMAGDAAGCGQGAHASAKCPKCPRTRPLLLSAQPSAATVLGCTDARATRRHDTKVSHTRTRGFSNSGA